MPSYLDFDSTKSFRNKILGKTLNRPNGPQTFTNTDYAVQKLSDVANKDLDNVEENKYSPAHISSVFQIYRNNPKEAINHLDDDLTDFVI